MSGKPGMTMHRWTAEERDYLAQIAPGRSHAEIRELMTERFGDHYGGKRISAALKRYGIRTGRTGRFEKGGTSWNKGRPWAEWMPPESQERSRTTCFKKGEVNGIAAQRMQPVGSERVNRDGYVEVKVTEGLQSRPNVNFRPKHHLVYEQAYGSIPRGCNVVFADRDRRNFDPDNLVAVPRALWAIITHRGISYHNRETLEAAMAVAELDKAVYAARRRPRACRRCGSEFAPRYPHQRTCDSCLEARKRKRERV